MKTYPFICNNIASLILENEEAAQNVQREILQEEVNWQAVITLASGWLVLPTLYDNLEKLKLWDNIPKDIYLYLKTVHELSEERSQKTQADIKTIQSYFAGKNIPTIALKGASYHVTSLYSEITFRIESDIDLLIPDNYLTLAYSLLKENGFSAAKKAEEQWEKCPTSHHLPPLLDQSGTEVEIHWMLYPRAEWNLLTSAEVWDQATSPLPNLPQTPSPTHMIMLLLLHSITDANYCMHVLNLRTAQDTMLIRQQHENEIDWEFIEKRFRAVRLQHIPASYFQAIECFLGQSSPAIFKKTWQTSLFIQRIRFNHWFGRTMPRLNQFLFPIKRRFCHEKNIIGKLIKEYWVRLYNKISS